jgi:hypothetical protein
MTGAPGQAKLTPAIARNKRLGTPLRLVCIDEVQRYLEHPDHGKTILELLTDLAKVGPAVGIMLVLATQKPDSKVMPDSLRGHVGIRLAMKVMNWQSSDTILGAGAYPDLDASKLLRTQGCRHPARLRGRHARRVRWADYSDRSDGPAHHAQDLRARSGATDQDRHVVRCGGRYPGCSGCSAHPGTRPRGRT